MLGPCGLGRRSCSVAAAKSLSGALSSRNKLDDWEAARWRQSVIVNAGLAVPLGIDTCENVLLLPLTAARALLVVKNQLLFGMSYGSAVTSSTNRGILVDVSY
jgi:hypothetical protein